MRVVFDTNVIVAGLVAEGLCREIVDTHIPDHTPILSQPLWDELVAKLYDKFQIDAGELPFLNLYRRHATWVDPRPLEPPVCRDPDDDWVLATAVAGKADMIVTGDKDLLTLGQHRGIAILKTRQFLEHPLGD